MELKEGRRKREGGGEKKEEEEEGKEEERRRRKRGQGSKGKKHHIAIDFIIKFNYREDPLRHPEPSNPIR